MAACMDIRLKGVIEFLSVEGILPIDILRRMIVKMLN